LELRKMIGMDEVKAESNRDCVEYWIELIGESYVHIYREEEILWLIETEPTEISSYLSNQI